MHIKRFINYSFSLNVTGHVPMASNPASLITTAKPIKHRNQELRLKLPRRSPAVHSSFHQPASAIPLTRHTRTRRRARAPPASEGGRRRGWKHDSGVTIASADGSDAICVQSGLKLQLLRQRAMGGYVAEQGRGTREQGTKGVQGISSRGWKKDRAP